MILREFMCAAKFFKGGELKHKLVIDQKASIIGKVEDTVITEEGKLGLLVKHDKTENVILYDQVKNIDDVVLLRIEYEEVVLEAPLEVALEEALVEESIDEGDQIEKERIKEQVEDVIENNIVEKEELLEERVEMVSEVMSSMASSNICSNCGMANRAGLNFCTKCGTSLK
jgi:sporulation protein YlmC with PRC-barrel domain